MEWRWLVWTLYYYWRYTLWFLEWLVDTYVAQIVHQQLHCSYLAYLLFLARAKAGDSYAQYYVGMLLMFEPSIKGDYEQAHEWLLKAANNDYAHAQYYFGRKFEDGLGVDVDYFQAFDWFAKAAAGGDEKAMYSLGLLYYSGHGVPVNRERAYKWFLEAASHGHPYGAYMMAGYYLQGVDCERDVEQAHYWLCEAIKRNCQEAHPHLHALFQDPEWQALQGDKPHRSLMITLPYINRALVLQWNGWRKDKDEQDEDNA